MWQHPSGQHGQATVQHPRRSLRQLAWINRGYLAAASLHSECREACRWHTSSERGSRLTEGRPPVVGEESGDVHVAESSSQSCTKAAEEVRSSVLCWTVSSAGKMRRRRRARRRTRNYTSDAGCKSEGCEGGTEKTGCGRLSFWEEKLEAFGGEVVGYTKRLLVFSEMLTPAFTCRSVAMCHKNRTSQDAPTCMHCL